MVKYYIPISRRDYALANMLFKEHYGEELTIASAGSEYICADVHRCTVCRAKVQPRDKYCHECGALLHGA